MRRRKRKTGFAYVLSFFFFCFYLPYACVSALLLGPKKKKKKGLHLPCKAALPFVFVVAAVVLFMGEGKGVLDAIPSVKKPHFFLFFCLLCFSCVP